MTAEEIFAGESENIEFKSEIPAKSEKYMKTVVAFANGKGGKLVFGVENGTWAVTGFSKEEVFQKMDAITNAIFDSCEPKITPNIAVQEIDGSGAAAGASAAVRQQGSGIVRHALSSFSMFLPFYHIGQEKTRGGGYGRK